MFSNSFFFPKFALSITGRLRLRGNWLPDKDRCVRHTHECASKHKHVKPLLGPAGHPAGHPAALTCSL